MITTVLLTEHALTPHDVTRIAHLHDPQPARVHVVVPVDPERKGVVDVLDQVALGHFREAVSPAAAPSDAQADAAAQEAMEGSVRALRAEGAEAVGQLSPDDPVRTVLELVRRVQAQEVVVVTEPHLIEEALRRDWASRLREAAQCPVLHVVAGTDRVVS